jgi:hypothetical protein
MQYANPKSFISSCNTNTREKIKALAKPDEKHLHLRRSQRDRMAHFSRIKKRRKKNHAQKKQKERERERESKRGNRTNISPIRIRITPCGISGKRAFALPLLRLIIRCRARPLRNLFLFQMSGEGRKSSYATSATSAQWGERERDASYTSHPLNFSPAFNLGE